MASFAVTVRDGHGLSCLVMSLWCVVFTAKREVVKSDKSVKGGVTG